MMRQYQQRKHAQLEPTGGANMMATVRTEAGQQSSPNAGPIEQIRQQRFVTTRKTAAKRA